MLLQRAQHDDDDEVRDRATLYLSILQQLDAEEAAAGPTAATRSSAADELAGVSRSLTAGTLPMSLPALQKVLGEDVELVDGPAIVAEAVGKRLENKGLLSGSTAVPQHQFAVSDLTPSFADSARRFFGSGIALVRDPLWD